MAAYNIKDMVGTSTVKGRKEYQKSATLLKDFQMSGCLGCTRFEKKEKYSKRRVESTYWGFSKYFGKKRSQAFRNRGLKSVLELISKTTEKSLYAYLERVKFLHEFQHVYCNPAGILWFYDSFLSHLYSFPIHYLNYSRTIQKDIFYLYLQEYITRAYDIIITYLLI